MESDGRVSTSSIAQEQNIAQTTGWYRLSKVGGYKKSSVLGCEYRKTPWTEFDPLLMVTGYEKCLTYDNV